MYYIDYVQNIVSDALIKSMFSKMFVENDGRFAIMCGGNDGRFAVIHVDRGVVFNNLR